MATKLYFLWVFTIPGDVRAAVSVELCMFNCATKMDDSNTVSGSCDLVIRQGCPGGAASYSCVLRQGCLVFLILSFIKASPRFNTALQSRVPVHLFSVPLFL
ncbi:hypothetical protein ATANTOWER_023308 [Ataeniobius toweri]|uniref:Secreted protein n=1 Tax=Ataeniobius toweri TaxID=208326 RepID=A0ABU7A7T9_9TELE|nr:hypothetical protein [Ataeniobius toweri]